MDRLSILTRKNIIRVAASAILVRLAYEGAKYINKRINESKFKH